MAHARWLRQSPIDTPRKAMGDLLGHAVRFGIAGDVMAAGEGIETVLSARQAIPTMAMAAALSSAHLAAILFPDTLRRLYILRDNDPAGEGRGTVSSNGRTRSGSRQSPCSPRLKGLQRRSPAVRVEALRAQIRVQLAPQDVARFLGAAA